MVTENEIREQLRLFTGAKTATMLLEVKSVDEQNGLCVLTDNVVEYYNVRLQAIKSAPNGFCLIPKVGTMALTVRIEDTGSMMIINAVEYDKIVMRGGKKGGLVNVADLKDNLDSLKDYVEALKDAVSNGLNAVGAGSTASGPTGMTAFNNAMAGKSISFSDMEDKNIIH